MAKPEEKKQSFAFFRNIIADLRKVTWPTPREAIYLTGIVLLVSIVIGLVLGGLDWVLAWVVNNTLLG